MALWTKSSFQACTYQLFLTASFLLFFGHLPMTAISPLTIFPFLLFPMLSALAWRLALDVSAWSCSLAGSFSTWSVVSLFFPPATFLVLLSISRPFVSISTLAILSPLVLFFWSFLVSFARRLAWWVAISFSSLVMLVPTFLVVPLSSLMPAIIFLSVLPPLVLISICSSASMLLFWSFRALPVVCPPFVSSLRSPLTLFFPVLGSTGSCSVTSWGRHCTACRSGSCLCRSGNRQSRRVRGRTPVTVTRWSLAWTVALSTWFRPGRRTVPMVTGAWLEVVWNMCKASKESTLVLNKIWQLVIRKNLRKKPKCRVKMCTAQLGFGPRPLVPSYLSTERLQLDTKWAVTQEKGP